jgi:superfamily II DNA or RNA helicase
MIVENLLTVKVSELNVNQWRKLLHDLTFVKDDGTVVISYRRLITEGIYKLPRGAWSLLPDTITYDDRRSCPLMSTLDFTAKLDNVEKDERFAGQSEAVEAMILNEQGMIIRPPGSGKSLIALAFAALCQTRTLVLVHTEDILNQWIEYVETHIPEMKGKVGVIRGSQCEIRQITIATVQTLFKRYTKKPKSWWAQFGCIIADECHHASAATWEAVLNTCPAKFRFGFTASPRGRTECTPR